MQVRMSAEEERSSTPPRDGSARPMYSPDRLLVQRGVKPQRSLPTVVSMPVTDASRRRPVAVPNVEPSPESRVSPLRTSVPAPVSRPPMTRPLSPRSQLARVVATPAQRCDIPPPSAERSGSAAASHPQPATNLHEAPSTSVPPPTWSPPVCEQDARDAASAARREACSVVSAPLFGSTARRAPTLGGRRDAYEASPEGTGYDDEDRTPTPQPTPVGPRRTLAALGLV